MVALGTSDLSVFPVCLGGNVFGWTADEDASFQILDAYLEGGGDFVDTADVYSAWAEGHRGGESEAIIGRWLAARKNRDAVVIATKVAQHPQRQGLSAANIAAAADDSLKRLRTDRIDLYYAHLDAADAPLAETVEAFDALIKAGKVRYWALSNFSGERIEEALRIADSSGYARPVALQSRYNLVERAAYEADSVPVITRENIAGVPFHALAAGFLTGKYRADRTPSGARAGAVSKYLNSHGFAVVDALELIANQHGVSASSVAIAWLLAKPGVAAPIASASKPAQVRDIIEAANLALTDEQIATLDTASDPA